jgi:hypothetical protein
MPNQPKTPLRSFRVPDEVWKPALARAQREGTTLTAVLLETLEEYGKGEVRHAPDQA